jgi:hypothetical protein
MKNTHVINGFELLEANIVGIRDDRIAIIASESEAIRWANEPSKNSRRYHPYKETIIVHKTLESLKAFQRGQLKQAVLKKLTDEEREALGF